MRIILFSLLVAFTLSGELVQNETDVESVEDFYFEDLGKHHNQSSKCHARLNECHTIEAVLGVLSIGLLLINIVTIGWFNRMALRYQLARCFPRLAPRLEEEDEEPIRRGLFDRDEDDLRFR